MENGDRNGVRMEPETGNGDRNGDSNGDIMEMGTGAGDRHSMEAA